MECIDGTQAHHWLIESSNGQWSNGICKKCKQVEKFANSYTPVSQWKHNQIEGYKLRQERKQEVDLPSTTISKGKQRRINRGT